MAVIQQSTVAVLFAATLLSLQLGASVAFPARSLRQISDGGQIESPIRLTIDDVQPSPASIGSVVPLTYFGPKPSTVMKELVGPVQLLRSGTVDEEEGTLTFPIYRGFSINTNQTFWYVVTDTTDKANAEGLGLNPSGKLAFADFEGGYRQCYLGRGLMLECDNGYVDFSPERALTPGEAPNYFPPQSVTPGSTGEDGYVPLVKIGSHIYNAPIIAGDVSAEDLSTYCNGTDPGAYSYVHDRVLAICPNEQGTGGTVTVKLAAGFSFGKPILYVSFDSNVDVAATLEKSTYAPAMPYTVGGDDSLFSPIERIFGVVNGYTNSDINSANSPGGPGETTHPQRQGLNSAISDMGDPLNVFGGIPTVATDYSPLWDLNLGEWTQYAVDNSYRVRWLDEFQVLGFAQQGFVTGPGGVGFGSSGIIINCPVVMRFL